MDWRAGQGSGRSMRNLEIHNYVTHAQRSLRPGDQVIVTRDDGTEETRTVAWAPGRAPDETWVIGLVGIRGWYALCRVMPLGSE